MPLNEPKDVNLVACPFCGGPAEIVARKPPLMTTIFCKNQCAAWPHVTLDTKDEAIAAWNRRASSDDAMDVLRELVRLDDVFDPPHSGNEWASAWEAAWERARRIIDPKGGE